MYIYIFIWVHTNIYKVNAKKSTKIKNKKSPQIGNKQSNTNTYGPWILAFSMGKLNDKFLKLAYLYSREIIILQNLLNKDKRLMVNKAFLDLQEIPHESISHSKKKEKQIVFLDMDSNGQLLKGPDQWLMVGLGKSSARPRMTLNSSILYSIQF